MAAADTVMPYTSQTLILVCQSWKHTEQNTNHDQFSSKNIKTSNWNVLLKTKRPFQQNIISNSTESSFKLAESQNSNISYNIILHFNVVNMHWKCEWPHPYIIDFNMSFSLLELLNNQSVQKKKKKSNLI